MAVLVIVFVGVLVGVFVGVFVAVLVNVGVGVFVFCAKTEQVIKKKNKYFIMEVVPSL